MYTITQAPRSLSVIVPTWNNASVITRTLESIRGAIRFLHQQPNCDAVAAEIVVVDDGSTDGTLNVAERSLESSGVRFATVAHSTKTSAGVARNTGVKIASGELIFFCDADDIYFQEHIFFCFKFFEESARQEGGRFSIQTDRGQITVQVPNEAVAAIRTGVELETDIHPHWKAAIENCIPLNLCIRKDCHDFLEGFPEQKIPYNEIGGEDVSYQNLLGTFFKVAHAKIETVRYLRYPGNWFDRQLSKFRHPPPKTENELSETEEASHRLRLSIERGRANYLLHKLVSDVVPVGLMKSVNLSALGRMCRETRQTQMLLQLNEKLQVLPTE